MEPFGLELTCECKFQAQHYRTHNQSKCLVVRACFAWTKMNWTFVWKRNTSTVWCTTKTARSKCYRSFCEWRTHVCLCEYLAKSMSTNARPNSPSTNHLNNVSLLKQLISGLTSKLMACSLFCFFSLLLFFLFLFRYVPFGCWVTIWKCVYACKCVLLI